VVTAMTALLSVPGTSMTAGDRATLWNARHALAKRLLEETLQMDRDEGRANPTLAPWDEDFARVHDVLKKHAVEVVMAGDTHDFEYYKEIYNGRSMYHFVNGGGGAYLSIGTSLAWPKQPPVEECGHYPRADALTAALDARMPAWKQPLWFWVKHLDAWPSTPETVSPAFSYDRAPFFQSFMEIRVEGSTNTVRFWLYGSNGRLRWRDLHVHEDRIPNGQSANDPVEFSFPLRTKNR